MIVFLIVAEAFSNVVGVVVLASAVGFCALILSSAWRARRG